MRSPLSHLLWIIISLLCTTHTHIYAQNNTLRRCSQVLLKTRQVITESKSPNLQSLFPSLDPTYKKFEQMNNEWAECVRGQKAPLSSFQALNGKVYDIASLSGKVVVINFWFMSCVPCRAEMPALNRLVSEYKEKEVIFLGISPDKTEQIKPAFFKQNPFDFTIVPNAQTAADSFYITGYPTTYILNQQGIIQQAWIGFTASGMDQLAPYHKAKVVIDQLLIDKR